MRKAALSVDELKGSGFEEIGCWELNEARELIHKIDLPKRAGVYAFAIDGIVQYVGLASKSLHQRINFYRKPGTGQVTNLRLNEIIRDQIGSGAKVQILVAHPADTKWNGLTIKGPEGLEAGLIADFDLPWNVRGSASIVLPVNAVSATSVKRHSGRAGRILELLQNKPGLTGGEIAAAIYGSKGSQPQVNALLHQLMESGYIERRGLGGTDPYRYFSKG